MKIGFIICSTGFGGLEINVLKLAKWLNERKWEVLLYVLKDSKIQVSASGYNVTTHFVDRHKKYFDFHKAFKLSRLLEKHEINTLLVFDNADLDLVHWTKKFMHNRLKVIYQQQMQIGVAKKDFIHSMRYAAIDFWISPLELLKQEVIEKTKLNPDKIKVIPLCTEIEKFVSPKYTKDEARKKLNIDPSALFLGIIGRIDPKKGQLFVIKAIHELIKKGNDTRLLIVGEPTVNDQNAKLYFSEINSYIQENNLTDKVQIRSFTNDVNVFYNAIDIFVLASEGETFGMVTVEAMLSKLPIIGTDSVGTPEILNHGELGMLYEPNNVDNFCHSVQYLIQNPDQFTDMSIKAQKTAISKYSHIKECEQIEELINSSN